MKITIDKSVITLAEAPAAKELQVTYKDILDNETLEHMANRVCTQEVKDGRSFFTGKLIKVEKLEVCKNHNELTIWATVILEDFDLFVKTSFDVLQAEYSDRDSYDNYTRIYKLVD